MKRSRKSNAVLASGVNLCQAKPFSSVGYPGEVGPKYQDRLQAKASSRLNSVPVEKDLSPGFEGGFSVRKSKVKPPHSSKSRWKCPSKFVMDRTWQVAAGEESEEAKAQMFREFRVFEAIYPHRSAIPSNPSVSLDVVNEHYDDGLTPSVPLTPIEEEEEPADLAANPAAASQPPALPQGQSAFGDSNSSECNSPGVQQLANAQPVLGNLLNLSADVIIATSVALTVVMKSAEKGSLVNTELLIKMLSDPEMIHKLIIEPGAQDNVGVAPINTCTAPRQKSITEPEAHAIVGVAPINTCTASREKPIVEPSAQANVGVAPINTVTAPREKPIAEPGAQAKVRVAPTNTLTAPREKPITEPGAQANVGVAPINTVTAPREKPITKLGAHANVRVAPTNTLAAPRAKLITESGTHANLRVAPTNTLAAPRAKLITESGTHAYVRVAPTKTLIAPNKKPVTEVGAHAKVRVAQTNTLTAPRKKPVTEAGAHANVRVAPTNTLTAPKEKPVTEAGAQANVRVAPTSTLTAPRKKLVIEAGAQANVRVAPANTLTAPRPRLIAKPKAQANVIVAPTNTLTAPKPLTTIASVPSALPQYDMQRAAAVNFCNMPGTVGATLNTIPLQPGNVQFFGLNQPAPSPPLPGPQANFGMFPRLPNDHLVPAFLAMTQPNWAPMPPFPVNEVVPVTWKDVNYIKNLIVQHGVHIQHPMIAQNGNNPNHLGMAQNFNPGEMKPKNLKPCMYFKSPTGCRNGVNCTFRHDMPVQWGTGNIMDAHSAKRMKLSGVNTGMI